MSAELPVVAIVGRPNVGKSTLVNRIVGKRDAIVEEQPGVTRDRKEFPAEWQGRRFQVVDTGGWLAPGDPGLTGDEPALAAKVSAQADAAMRAADVIVLVVDVVTGPTEEDARVAKLLQRGTIAVIVAVNKVDDQRREPDIWQFARLGLGEPVAVSALHGRLSGELLEAIVAALPPEAAPDADADAETDGAAADDDGIFSVAIVGRPNVGKSTLFNRLVGEERSVVHDMPGTTRDAIDTIVETDDGPLRFVDTAGLRRKSRIDESTEYYGLVRALQAIDRADAALFLIDATEGVTHQDQRLAERVDAAGTAIVLVLNKWELLDTEDRAKVKREAQEKLGFLNYAPVLPISALTGRRVHHLLPALREAEAAYHKRIPTATLNRVLRDAQAAHPPPVVKKHRPRILYATQGASEPPTITLFTTRTLPPTYMRYLERKLREAFDFGPTPIKLRVRRRSESPRMAPGDVPGDVPSVHPVALQGERVSLREVSPDDATAAFAWAGDPRFFRYMAPEPVGSVAEEAEFLRSMQEHARARPHVQYHLGVVERSSDELIGMVRLGIVAPQFRGADLGYGLRADRWGQGLTAEAVGLVLAFGFEQLGLHRIAAVCDPNNVGSRRVMEKVGMLPEGRLRQDMRSQGRWRDSLAYAILEDEWRVARSADGSRH